MGARCRGWCDGIVVEENHKAGGEEIQALYKDIDGHSCHRRKPLYRR